MARVHWPALTNFALVYVAVSSVTAHFLASAAGSLNIYIAAIAVLGGIIAGGWAYVEKAGQKPVIRGSRMDRFLLIALWIFILRYFLYLLYPVDGELRTLHPNNLGDLPLHLTYIRHLAGGAFYPPENPLFSGTHLLYPLGIDLHNALYEVLGMNTAGHLFLVGGALTGLTLLILFHHGNWPAVIGFFLNGGLLGWWFYFRGTATAPTVWAWKDFITSLWITQRGLLWALPTGIVLLAEVRAVLHQRQSVSWTALLLLAAMPFFHLHSFLFFALLFCWLWAVYPVRRKALLSWWWSLPPILYFVYRSTDGFSKASVIHWHWGWMAGDESDWLFWFWNLGPWAVFITWLMVELWRRRGTQVDRAMATGYVIFFALFSCVMFAPWEWDNLKMLIWPYLGLLLLGGFHWKALPLPESWKAAILFVMALGGLFGLAVNGEWRGEGQKIYAQAELNSVEKAVRGVAKNAVFAAWPTYDHPLSFFGYKLAMGYPGHLWSHGIDSRRREDLLRRIMTGEEDWRKLADELGVDYLYWGERERLNFGGSPPWRSQLKNISSVNGIEIYATKN